MKSINSVDNLIQVIDRQLFTHQFQPIMDIENNKILGYEGLLRSSFVKNPEILFDFAIQTNRLFELDSASITKAMNNFHNTLKKQSGETYLFLNVYPSSLLSPEFLPTLDHICSHLQISPRRLIIELTEYENIVNLIEMSRQVNRLQDKGYQIALDDIGKGQQIFEKILEIEADIVKLDRYFTKDISISVHKQKMIKLLIEYFAERNIKVILEGIETEKELQIAKALGVQYMQGYYLGKPDTLENWLLNRYSTSS